MPQPPRFAMQQQPSPRGPSGFASNQGQPGVNGGSQQQHSNGRNTPTAPVGQSSRPSVSRMPSASLPPRPNDTGAAQQQQQKSEQSPRNAEPPVRGQDASNVLAARQAAFDSMSSMNAPKKPADTASAVAARERGGAARSGNVTPSHDRVSRDEPSDSTRSARPASSRDVSPSRPGRSRAASPTSSSHSAAKSQGAQRDANDDAERERNTRPGDRERPDRAPDMYATRREQRARDEAGRRAAEPSSRSGDRDSDRRSRGGSRQERSSSGRQEPSSSASSRNKEQDDTASSSLRSRRNEGGRMADEEPASKRRHRDDRDAETKGLRIDTPSGLAADRAPRSAPESNSPSAGQKRPFSEFSARIGDVDTSAGSEPNVPGATEPIVAPDSKRLKIKGRGSETAEAAHRERERMYERSGSQAQAPEAPRDAPPRAESQRQPSGHVVSIRGNARAADERMGGTSRQPRPEPAAEGWGSSPRDPERSEDHRGGGRRQSHRSHTDRKAQRKDRRAGAGHN